MVQILAVFVLFGGCGKPKQDDPERTVSVVDLLQLLPRASVQAPEPRYVALAKVVVAGEEREALFMHPPSRATYPPARMNLESRLELSMGVNEDAWEEPGDGVQFSVYAKATGEEEVRIFSTFIDPKHEMRDRRWVDAIVTLGTYAGQDVSLILETDPGPAADGGWDWAAWSRATLILGQV